MFNKVTEVKVSEDRESGVVYISFGEPVEAVCTEVRATVLFRYSRRVGELVGITIVPHETVDSMELKEKRNKTKKRFNIGCFRDPADLRPR